MRSVAAICAMLITGGVPVAFADPPPAAPVPPESRSSPAQNSTADSSTNQKKADTTAPPRAAPPSLTPSESDERLQEQLLRLQGYKPSMVRGEMKYCRRETALGTRIAAILHCVTIEEAIRMAKEGRELTERVQRNTTGCVAQRTQNGSPGYSCGN